MDTKWTTVYCNAPSFRRTCKKCGRVWHPIDSKDACYCEVEYEPADKPPCSLDDMGCGCEPCPFDLRTLGYPTCKEDPYFEGTQCNWHEIIRGTRGTLCVSGGTKDAPRFAIDIRGQMEQFGLSEVHAYLNKIGAKR